ncbi:hypothetical protein [Xenorhabdus griffiniae]|uniref:hypothetical protein n=1 Tax=Xenorhabdus griffiniae TaxID=351672 RepID=UPI00235A27F6|nr:hypothetical protein [Xenorhabdus griffiniae]MDC9604943.1 hypothetical protein [Xenorhabdus griffiniae]
MKFNSQYFTLGALVFVSGLLWFYYSEYQDKAEKYDSLKRQYDNQIAITDNTFNAIRVINELSRINSEDRNRATVDSEKMQAAIKTVVVNHDCANRTVPDGAVTRLQQHTNRIRSDAASADPSALAR